MLLVLVGLFLNIVTVVAGVIIVAVFLFFIIRRRGGLEATARSEFTAVPIVVVIFLGFGFISNGCRCG